MSEMTYILKIGEHYKEGATILQNCCSLKWTIIINNNQYYIYIYIYIYVYI